MTREEAIEVYNGLINTKIKEAFEFFAPELAESEDERIRSALLRGFNSMLANQPAETFYGESIKDIIDYLERQKDSPMPEDTVIFQKGVEEGRRLEREDMEKKRLPIIETYQRSWYTEGYYDGKLKKEPRWIIKTKGICTEYEENPKYGQSLEDEQKPPITGNDFGWIDELKHDLEHPEELDQKVDDVLKQRKGIRSFEWSEEDELMRTAVIQTLETFGGRGTTGMQIDWMKSLRPQPKQEWSEEDDQLIGFIFDLLNDLVWRKDWAMSKEECLERLKSLRPSWKPSKEEPEYYQHFDPDC